MDDLVLDGFSEISIELNFEGDENVKRSNTDNIREPGSSDIINSNQCVDNLYSKKFDDIEPSANQQTSEYEEIGFE